MLTDVQKLNKEKMYEYLTTYIDELKYIENKINKKIKELNDERLSLYKDIKNRLFESLSPECSLLNKACDLHIKDSETNKALDLKELLNRILENALDVVIGVICQYDDAIKNIFDEVWRVVEEKNDILSEIIKYINEKELDFIQEEYKNKIDARNKSNTPKTHNELKKYLESNGFEIKRYNGLHKIYKNIEGWEVRVLPSRRGAHVLSQKTRKKIIEGVVEM